MPNIKFKHHTYISWIRKKEIEGIGCLLNYFLLLKRNKHDSAFWERNKRKVVFVGVIIRSILKSFLD